MAVSSNESVGHALTELRQTGTRIPHKIFIGGLAEQTQESDIREAILEVDPNTEIQAVQVIHDRSVPTKTNEPRRYAFVEFGSEAEVKKILEMIASLPEPLEVHGRRWTFGQAYRKAYSARRNMQGMYGIPMVDPMAYYRLMYAASAANLQKNIPMMPGYGCFPMVPMEYGSVMSPYGLLPSPYASVPSSPQVVPTTPISSPYSMKPSMHDSGYGMPMSNGGQSFDELAFSELAYKLTAVQMENNDIRGRMNMPMHHVQPPMDSRFINQSPASSTSDARHFMPQVGMVHQFAQ